MHEERRAGGTTRDVCKEPIHVSINGADADVQKGDLGTMQWWLCMTALMNEFVSIGAGEKYQKLYQGLG